MMASIIQWSEKDLNKWSKFDYFATLSQQKDSLSITRAAKELASDRNVAAIIVFTQSGRTARLMSKTRPDVPIFAFTPELRTYHKMGLYWGVTPIYVPYADTLETMLKHVDTAIITATKLEKGQKVILISGFPVGAFRQPNLALLYTLGEI